MNRNAPGDDGLDAWARSRVLAAVIAGLGVAGAPGCKSKDTPNVEKRGAIESTGTVQAEIPSGATATVQASGFAGTNGGGTSSGTTTAPSSTQTNKPTAPTIWPAKVGQFARAVGSPIWYPKSLPAGWKLDSVDVIELDKGTGLVCDIVFLKGDKALVFTQGSPKERSYDVVSSQRVAWGYETADVVHQDPADPSSPVIIVYNRGGNFAELQGDPSLAELKAIAEGMVPVK